jgi:FkbM family methyltransferase
MEYDALTGVRHDDVAGVAPWLWIHSDGGAWEGPKSDWEDSHLDAIKLHVEDFRICIQAGGNQGMYPRLLKQHFEHVYTFEPDPLNFYCLTYNCQDDNIYKMQAALGSETGLARVNRLSMQNTGCHTVSTDGDCFVPMITIDTLNLPHCGYMQLDLELYELNAIRGAAKTIERFKPVIQCENGNDQIMDFLKPFGYEIVGYSRADTIYKVV